MPIGRPRRILNPGSWLALLGMLTVGASLLAPSLTATRVARVERRAFEIVRALLDVAVALEPLSFDTAREELTRRLHERAEQLGHPRSAWPEPVSTPPDREGLWFATKHYLFQLVRTPADEYAAAAPEAPRLEAHAWPDSLLGPGHTVFFLLQGSLPAYSRNLLAEYAGLHGGPRPGAPRPRATDLRPVEQGWYRGYDDERWIFIP